MAEARELKRSTLAVIEKVGHSGDNIKHTQIALKDLYQGVRFLSDVLSGEETGVLDHGALTGLGDDDHPQYFLLGGRGASQSAFGGTGVTGSLALESNAAGGSTSARIQLTATPAVIFDIASGTVDPLTLSLGLVSGTLTGRSLTVSLVGVGGNSSRLEVDNGSGSAATVPFKIIPHASQSADRLQVRNSADNANVVSVSSAGNVVVIGGTSGVPLSVAPTTDLVPLNVSGLSGGTANVAQFFGAAGAEIMRVTNSTSTKSVGVPRIALWNTIGSGSAGTVQPGTTFTADRTISVPDFTGQMVLRLSAANRTNIGTTLTAQSLLSGGNAVGNQQYFVSMYAVCTTGGSAGDNIQVSISYTDTTGAQTVNIDSCQLATAGTRGQGTFTIFHTAGNAITYTSTLTATGAPFYNLYLRASLL